MLNLGHDLSTSRPKLSNELFLPGPQTLSSKSPSGSTNRDDSERNILKKCKSSSSETSPTSSDSDFVSFCFVSDENETISLIPLHLPELFRFQLSPINRKLLREPEKEEVKSQQCGKTLDWNLFFQQDNLTQGWSNSDKTRVLAPGLRK